MTTNSRREFFKNFSSKRLDPVKKSRDGDIVTIGNLAAFPVDTKSKIKIKNIEMTVESLPVGIRLRNEDAGKNFKLSLSNNGLLLAHLNEEWPEAAVLSIFTGEIYNI